MLLQRNLVRAKKDDKQLQKEKETRDNFYIRCYDVCKSDDNESRVIIGDYRENLKHDQWKL